MASEATREDVPNGNGTGVGALLKASRQRIGEDLPDVARMLRIRYPYLEAIEAGNYQDLPGATYAVGFIRAYADHLGLDSDEVVRRYKAESTSGGAKNDLRFPTPVPETGIPTGAVVFLGVLIAAVSYGAWYVGTAKEGFFAELISPIPERLESLLDKNEIAPASTAGKPAEPAAEHAPEGSSETESASVPRGPVETPPPADVEPEQAPVVSTESAPAPAPSTDTVSGDGQPATPAAETASVVAAPGAPAGSPVSVESPPAADTTQSTVAPAATSVPDAAPESTSEATVTEGAPVVADTGSAATTAALSGPTSVEPMAPETADPTQITDTSPASASPPEEAPASVASTLQASSSGPAAVAPSSTNTSAASGDESAPETASAAASAEDSPSTEPEESIVPVPASRILVRAAADSWIQVRDDFENRILVTRLMKAGDSYSVPDQPGLTLLTGNAGALEILVDGEAVPSIGGDGAVRQGVSLDAELLRAGNAVAQ